MLTLNCATGTIAPYIPSSTVPWNRRRVSHLLRRMGFGASPQRIEQLLNSSLSPSEIVDAIIDNALNKPLPAMPEWGDWSLSDYDQDDVQEQATQQVYEWITGWMDGMASNNNFREKLELFWHNHFVTRLDDYGCPSYMYRYHTLLQQHALGNFKTFTVEMGKTPAMLFFLNGVQSTRFEPNENYARELCELFTLGQDNGYTQQDIVETARALTGWNNISEACADINFAPLLHDNGVKTIFGQTGNWGYDDVHDILFEQRSQEIAHFICTKIYAYFINPEVETTIVDAMVATFLENNFELAPVFRQLFKSEHFFDEANMDVQVASPIDMMMQFVTEATVPHEEYFDADANYNQLFLTMYFLGANLGQQLMNPVDVAGWQGNRAWVNSSSLVGRWQVLDVFIFEMYQDLKYVLVDFAKTISGNATDPDFIAQRIVEHFIPVGLQTPEDYQRAALVFRSDYVPANYYQDGTWTLDYDENVVAAQVALLMRHISRIPEYQLS